MWGGRTRSDDTPNEGCDAAPSDSCRESPERPPLPRDGSRTCRASDACPLLPDGCCDDSDDARDGCRLPNATGAAAPRLFSAASKSWNASAVVRRSSAAARVALVRRRRTNAATAAASNATAATGKVMANTRRLSEDSAAGPGSSTGGFAAAASASICTHTQSVGHFCTAAVRCLRPNDARAHFASHSCS